MMAQKQARKSFDDYLSTFSEIDVHDFMGDAAPGTNPQKDPDGPTKAYELPLDLIDEDPNQPRTDFSEDEKFQDMVRSISVRGVKTAISVRDNPDRPGRYIINHGAQRFRASRIAGRNTIPAHIDNDYTEFDQLVENVQRRDLSPYEIGAFLHRLLKAGKHSQAEIGKLIGKSKTYINKHLAFVNPPQDLIPVFRDYIKDAQVGAELRRMHLLNPEEVMQWLNDYGLRKDEDGRPISLSMSVLSDLKRFLNREKIAALSSNGSNAPVDAQTLKERKQGIDKRLQTLSGQRQESAPPQDLDYPAIRSDLTDTADVAEEEIQANRPASDPVPEVTKVSANGRFALNNGSSVCLMVEYRKQGAVLDLGRKPSKPGRVFLRYLDGDMAVEVDLKKVKLTDLIIE
jgi:korB